MRQEEGHLCMCTCGVYKYTCLPLNTCAQHMPNTATGRVETFVLVPKVSKKLHKLRRPISHWNPPKTEAVKPATCKARLFWLPELCAQCLPAWGQACPTNFRTGHLLTPWYSVLVTRPRFRKAERCLVSDLSLSMWTPFLVTAVPRLIGGYDQLRSIVFSIPICPVPSTGPGSWWGP